MLHLLEATLCFSFCSCCKALIFTLTWSMQCLLNPTVNRANGNVLRIKPWHVLTTVKDWTFTSKQRKMGNTAEGRWLRLKGHICHTAEEWITAGCESLLFVFVFKRHIQMAKLQFFLPQRKKFRLKLKLG